MADISQTAANVLMVSGGEAQDATAGEAGINAGMPVYLNTTDSKWYKAQNDGNAAQSGVDGTRIALNRADGAGQPFRVFLSGSINLGGTLTVGQTYVVSANAGAVAPISDLATNASHLKTPAAGPFPTNTLRA